MKTFNFNKRQETYFAVSDEKKIGKTRDVFLYAVQNKKTVIRFILMDEENNEYVMKLGK